MKCPHGNTIEIQTLFGMHLYLHEDGERCSVLNRLDLPCTQIAMFTMRRYGREPASPHMERMGYASYKVSADIRFSYLKTLAEAGAYAFRTGFSPVRMALLSEDDYASKGLYLMELYFAFCGFSSRLSAVNEALCGSPLCRFLEDIGARRFVATEDGYTRAYAQHLDANYPEYKNQLDVPENIFF